MKKIIIFFTIFLLLFFTSCAKEGFQNISYNKNDPKEVVQTYIRFINDAKYDSIFQLLDHKKAIVWPGIGIIEELTNKKIKDKLVDITIESISNPVNLGDSPDEIEIVTQMHLKPTQKALSFGKFIGAAQEKDTFMIFYAIKRNDGYKLSKSFEVDSLVAHYIETKPKIFVNIKSAIPREVTKGEEVELVFDLNVAKAMGTVPEVGFMLYPEPNIQNYPYSYETVVSTQYSSGSEGKKEITHFAFLKETGSNFPDEQPQIYFVGPLEIDKEASTGIYRLYLRVTNILYPIPPYLIEIK